MTVNEYQIVCLALAAIAAMLLGLYCRESSRLGDMMEKRESAIASAAEAWRLAEEDSDRHRDEVRELKNRILELGMKTDAAGWFAEFAERLHRVTLEASPDVEAGVMLEAIQAEAETLYDAFRMFALPDRIQMHRHSGWYLGGTQADQAELHVAMVDQAARVLTMVVEGMRLAGVGPALLMLAADRAIEVDQAEGTA